MYNLQNYIESESENCSRRDDLNESFHSLNETTSRLHSFDAPQFIFKPRRVSQLVLDSSLDTNKEENESSMTLDLMDSVTNRLMTKYSSHHLRSSYINSGNCVFDREKVGFEEIKNIDEIKEYVDHQKKMFEVSMDSIQNCWRPSMASSISSLFDEEKKRPPIYESTPISAGNVTANRKEETMHSDQCHCKDEIPSDYINQSRIFKHHTLKHENQINKASNDNTGVNGSIATTFCKTSTTHRSFKNLNQIIGTRNYSEETESANECKRNQNATCHTSLQNCCREYGCNDNANAYDSNFNNYNNTAPNISKLQQYLEEILATNRDPLLLPVLLELITQGSFNDSDINDLQKIIDQSGQLNDQPSPSAHQVQEMIYPFKSLANHIQENTLLRLKSFSPELQSETPSSYFNLPIPQSSASDDASKNAPETLMNHEDQSLSIHVTRRKETMADQNQEWEEFERMVCNRDNLEKAQEEFERKHLNEHVKNKRVEIMDDGIPPSLSTISSSPLSPLATSLSLRTTHLQKSNQMLVCQQIPQTPKLVTQSQSQVFLQKSQISFKPSISQSLEESPPSSTPSKSLKPPSSTQISLERSLRASDSKFLQLKDTYKFMRLSLGEGCPKENGFIGRHGNDSTITLEPSLDYDDLVKVEGYTSIFDSIRDKDQGEGVLIYRTVNGIRVPCLLLGTSSSISTYEVPLNIKTTANMTVNSIVRKENKLSKKMEYKYSPCLSWHGNKNVVGDQLWSKNVEAISTGNDSDVSPNYPATKDEHTQVTIEDIKPAFESKSSSDPNQHAITLKRVLNIKDNSRALPGCGAFTPELLDLEGPASLGSLDGLPKKFEVEGNVTLTAPTAWTINFSDKSHEAISLQELLQLKRPHIIRSLKCRSELLNSKFLTFDSQQTLSESQKVEQDSKNLKLRTNFPQSFSSHPRISSSCPRLSTNEPNLSTNQPSLYANHPSIASIHPSTTYPAQTFQDLRFSKTISRIKKTSFVPRTNLNIFQKKAVQKSPSSLATQGCKVKPKPLHCPMEKRLPSKRVGGPRGIQDWS